MFGGFTPFLLTWLVAKTGDKLMPAHYLVGFLILGVISLRFYKESDGNLLPTGHQDNDFYGKDVDLVPDAERSARKA